MLRSSMIASLRFAKKSSLKLQMVTTFCHCRTVVTIQNPSSKVEIKNQINNNNNNDTDDGVGSGSGTIIISHRQLELDKVSIKCNLFCDFLMKDKNLDDVQSYLISYYRSMKKWPSYWPLRPHWEMDQHKIKSLL